MQSLIGLNSNFNKLLEKATSHLLLEPDWPTILSLCDLIRQNDISPKQALAAITKKITNENPHVAGFGLLVLESCVKNCGSLIHDEVGTKQYMEQLKEIAKTTKQEPVRNKILELIQAWAYAFRDSPKYRAVVDTMRIMKAENFEFPVLQESDAMFTADNAPEWQDGDKCHRCRTAFTTFQRKHHCRACGQVFCHQCSAKNSTIPKYGIEKEVRVCNTCYDLLNKPVVPQAKETELPVEYLTSSLAQQQQVPPRKTEEELREEEELQIALALSQSEAEHKEKEKKRVTSAIISNSTAFSKVHYSPPPSPVPSPTKQLEEEEEEEVDPELAKYLNRQYWEQRHNALEEQASRLSATSPSAPNISSPMPQKVIAVKPLNGEVDPEMKNFVENLRSQVEIFVNRMKSDSSRGRSIANDSSVQTLFMNITALHSRLLRYIQDQEDKRVYFEGLQDKLTQIKDARGALDALREEHRLALLREKQEADRKRQMQMAQKLEIMRKKKQEYLQYQRQVALNRIQEQEREMQIRQEQQKQQYKMAGYSPVTGYMSGPSQSSPVRQNQYPDGTVYPVGVPVSQPMYSFPTSGPGTAYPGYMMQQPQHQQQSVIESMAQEARGPPVEADIQSGPESLGRVTVSGPAMQIPSMQVPNMPQQQQQPQQPGAPSPSHPPVQGQTVGGQMGPGVPPGHPVHMLPPHLAAQQQQQPHGHVQMLPNGSIVQRQQIVIPGQGQSIGRQLPMPGQLASGVPISGPNPMVMTSNGPTPGPLQQISGQNPMAINNDGQMQGPQQIPSTGQMIMTSNGPVPIPQHMQTIPGAEPTALPGPRIPLTQAQLLQLQHQQQLAQQQQQEQPPQPQDVHDQKVAKEEEDRKSPEVAELISFD
ncbi:hypothetical protein QAD02_006125 [Eretmocerus hayati]|uniref:Uncharacterized protein n=1 Tax=Eretmocerus hayati TaxID=131215 RepID=A0ACC2N045_9HYME|nr:hypothetical protein QAD02_006125 [Eretmocerus hayati]